MKFQLLTTSVAAALSAVSTVASKEASSSVRTRGRVLKGVAFPQQVAGAIQVYKEGDEKSGTEDESDDEDDSKSKSSEKDDNRSSSPDDESSDESKSKSSPSSSSSSSAESATRHTRTSLGDRFEDLCKHDNEKKNKGDDKIFCDDMFKHGVCDPKSIEKEEEEDKELCEWLGFEYPDFEMEDRRKRDIPSVGTFKVLKGVAFPQKIAGSIQVLKETSDGTKDKDKDVSNRKGGDHKGRYPGYNDDKDVSNRKGGDSDDKDDEKSKPSGKEGRSSSSDDESSSSTLSSSSSRSGRDDDKRRERRQKDLGDHFEGLCDPDETGVSTSDEILCVDIWDSTCDPEKMKVEDDYFCDWLGFPDDVVEYDSYDSEGEYDSEREARKNLRA